MLYPTGTIRKDLFYYLCFVDYSTKYEISFVELTNFSKRINKDLFILSFNHIYRLENYFVLGCLQEFSEQDMLIYQSGFSMIFFIEYPIELENVKSFYRGLENVRKRFIVGCKVFCPSIAKDYYAIIKKIFTQSVSLNYYFPIREEPYSIIVDFKDVVMPLNLVEVLKS